MTAPLWAGLLLLAFGAIAILRIRLSRQQQVAALVLAAAVGLVVLRQFALAIPVAILGLGLWRRGGPIPEPPDDTSEVETPALRMTLDHGTGRMDGEVLTGRFAGARLSGLSAEDLEALVAEIEGAGDEDSLAVLLAWLDRQGTPREAPPPGGQPMTEAEAYRILGLEPGASLEEVRAAHRRLIRRVHPDLGGSSALAAMINAAKEMLDPG